MNRAVDNQRSTIHSVFISQSRNAVNKTMCLGKYLNTTKILSNLRKFSWRLGERIELNIAERRNQWLTADVQ